MSTFVLVHGAWAGGWIWDKVVPLLKEAGHEVVAPDLPGHGEDRIPISEVSMQGYADCVREVLDAQSGQVVLVGHSLGGAVISQAAEQRPEKIEKLVYLAAFLLRDGETVISVAENDEEAIILPSLEMSEDQTYANIRDDAVKEVVCADSSDDDVERMKSLFVPQATAPFGAPIAVTEDNFGNLPRAYVETLQDRAISPPSQKGMYERTPCQQVVSMDTSHTPMLSAPEELTENLESLARV